MSAATDRRYILQVVQRLTEGGDPLGVAEIFYAAAHYVHFNAEARSAVADAMEALLNTIEPQYLQSVCKEAGEQDRVHAQMYNEWAEEDAKKLAEAQS